MEKLMKFLCSAVFCIVVALGMPQMARAAEVTINETNFPDEIFREYVLENCDKDENWVLSEEEIKNTTKIDVNQKRIANLKGVEYFINLVYLYCNNNQLTSIDISHNSNLYWLDCGDNQLTSIDVSYNLNLQLLYCQSNQLTSIDVSHNLSLYLLCCGGNQLTSIDISHNLDLMMLYCSDNQLTSIDVSHNPSLKELYCQNNQLTSIDISHNLSLKTLYCYTNELTSLKLNKQVYDKLSLKNSYLHSENYSDTIPETATAILSNLSNVTETNGIIKVIDINKPATYQYTYGGKKIDFTIFYVDPDENPEKTFKITYVLNGGTNAVENSTVYVEGIGVASFANATKLNATFDGWYLDAAFTQKITSIGTNQTGDITLYAKFISSDLNNVVTSFCERLFYDYEYKDSVSGTAITLYGNCRKNTDTIKKDMILYTDILASYDYSINKGKVKTSTGKVIAGITMSDTKPTITKNKIIDSEAAKIAKAKIKNGQITVTATGKASGVVYLWIMDTGNKGVSECCPINVKLAPKKLEVQEITGSKANKLKIVNGSSKEIKIAGLVGTIKTEDCTYTAIVNSKSQNYVSVTTLDDKSFTLKGTGLKNDKDTKVSITFTCKENGKKVKFTTTITKSTT